MSNEVQESYLSRDWHQYHFSYAFQNGSWRIYVNDHPSYGQRSPSLQSTHRYYDTNRPGYYVCWTRPISSLSAANAVAHLWAESTDVYLRTGSFPGAQPSWWNRLKDFLRSF